ncbi:hypothetical protein [Bacillus thuringiensis]|uniref:hypothetical protein n=1 Tax=Bacillus thuringiensis TaxID=1428 RepID=UPI0021D6514E|nr:hypothetical protein [Bacillus thuringiensis]MCU7667676.1 hypothetical protein [Bacillus thuringiensis]
MLVQEIEQYFQKYELKNITFHKAEVSEENRYALMDLELYFTYKKRTIQINFFLNTLADFFVRKSIPTKNKEVIKEVEEVVKNVLVFLQEDSCYRMAILYKDSPPRIHEYSYNPFIDKIIDAFIISCYSAGRTLSWFVPVLWIYLSFKKYDILTGILMGPIAIGTCVIIHAGFKFTVSDDANTALKAQKQIVYSGIAMIVSAFIMCVTKII